MDVIDFLDKAGVDYEVTEHKPVFTAQRMAAEEHEAGKYVAKPVIVKADGKYIMCVVAACYRLNLQTLRDSLGAESVELAEENELSRIFSNCELGAEPPFGNLYALPTVMDKRMEADDHIVFQAGSHKKAARMSMEDYRRLVKPKLLDFSYHTT